MFSRAQTLDPEKPLATSGVRVGLPAITTREFGVEEAVATAHLIADTLDSPQDAEAYARVHSQVAALTGRFPVYSPAAA